MKANMGTIDRVLRVLIAIAVGALYYFEVINGLTAIILGILAIVFLVTSLVSFCPLYYPFRITTRKNQ